MNEIQKHQQSIKNNILKGFTNLDDELKKAEEEELEKARSGRYADTPENRKLNRVGQEYSTTGKQKDQSGNKTPKGGEDSKDGSSGDTKLPDNNIAKHLADTPTAKLKEYVKKEDAKYLDEAKAEIKKREGGNDEAKNKDSQKEQPKQGGGDTVDLNDADNMIDYLLADLDWASKNKVENEADVKQKFSNSEIKKFAKERAADTGDKIIN